jgi:hypothetical protein
MHFLGKMKQLVKKFELGPPEGGIPLEDHENGSLAESSEEE